MLSATPASIACLAALLPETPATTIVLSGLLQEGCACMRRLCGHVIQCALLHVKHRPSGRSASCTPCRLCVLLSRHAAGMAATMACSPLGRSTKQSLLLQSAFYRDEGACPLCARFL
jgi:hypothetical protein